MFNCSIPLGSSFFCLHLTGSQTRSLLGILSEVVDKRTNNLVEHQKSFSFALLLNFPAFINPREWPSAGATWNTWRPMIGQQTFQNRKETRQQPFLVVQSGDLPGIAHHHVLGPVVRLAVLFSELRVRLLNCRHEVQPRESVRCSELNIGESGFFVGLWITCFCQSVPSPTIRAETEGSVVRHFICTPSRVDNSCTGSNVLKGLQPEILGTSVFQF